MGVKTLRVGVLMGGQSAEREISLKTGRAICQALTRRGYQVIQIDVDGSICGLQQPAVRPGQLGVQQRTDARSRTSAAHVVFRWCAGAGVGSILLGDEVRVASTRVDAEHGFGAPLQD